MKSCRFAFRCGAPAMIYGHDLLENTRALSARVPHIEILLFHTASLHNIPSPETVAAMRRVGDQNGCIFTVHLPASLEIASADRNTREHSLRLAVDLWRRMQPLNPAYYILHIPVTSPTLVFDPSAYVTAENTSFHRRWTRRARESLARIDDAVGLDGRLLLENINYPPLFLHPLVAEGYARFCLDLGHLLLGGETVVETLDSFLALTGEIHLHGVDGTTEHLPLSVLPFGRVTRWIACLVAAGFEGLLNIEVFCAQDLDASMGMLREIERLIFGPG